MRHTSIIILSIFRNKSLEYFHQMWHVITFIDSIAIINIIKGRFTTTQCITKKSVNDRFLLLNSQVIIRRTLAPIPEISWTYVVVYSPIFREFVFLGYFGRNCSNLLCLPRRLFGPLKNAKYGALITSTDYSVVRTLLFSITIIILV